MHRYRVPPWAALLTLVPQIQEPGTGAKVAAALFGTGTQRKGNVIAIRIHGKKKGR